MVKNIWNLITGLLTYLFLLWNYSVLDMAGPSGVNQNLTNLQMPGLKGQVSVAYAECVKSNARSMIKLQNFTRFSINCDEISKFID